MARILPDWIEGYLEYTDNTEPPYSYRIWMAISTIAAVLQRKCWFSLGSELWYPNFFIILTGPPVARKGTAMRPALQLMKECGVSFAADEGSRQKLIARLEKAKTFFRDPTLGYHSSITIAATELTVFLKRNEEDMLSMLQKWFDCEDQYTYDTYAHNEQHILNIWVNIIGATTPTLLQTTLPTEAFGAGFICRTLFIYEHSKEKAVIFPTLNDEMHQKLAADLEEIATLEGRFSVENAEAFMDLYSEFYFGNEKNPPIKDIRLEKYNDRRAMHLCKLCMIISASRTNDRVITCDDFRRALKILKAMEKKMPAAFRGVGANPLAATQDQIMRTLALKGMTTYNELMNIYHADINLTQLSDIISSLQTMGYCKRDGVNIIYCESFKGI